MKLRITPGICYVAGLAGKSRQKEKNAVGITTSIEQIEQRFIELVIKELEIEPSKILIEENNGHRHVYFYHSRVAKRLKEIYSREVYVFKKRDALSASYVAGMFDASGSIRDGGISMSPMGPHDSVMLDNLGIHTSSKRILTITSFLELIKSQSILAQRLEA